MRLNRSTGGGADRKGRVLVVETQTTTEDLLEGGTLAAEAGESAFAVSEEEHVAETAGNGLVYRFVKRAFDIAFSLCVVVVGLAPIALLLLIIRLESPGSPIYRQERIGYRGQPLRIFKLRTMVADSDDVEKHLSPEQLAQWRSERKVEDDPRVTRVGRFLRRTSLDELPQFLNVLAGSIPLRIIKTGQGEPCEISGLFALPAKELRTQKALFPQVKVASGTCLRTVQNFFSNHTAQRAQTQRILTKRKFTHISWGGGFGGLTLCESWLLSYGTTSGLVN